MNKSIKTNGGGDKHWERIPESTRSSLISRSFNIHKGLEAMGQAGEASLIHPDVSQGVLDKLHSDVGEVVGFLDEIKGTGQVYRKRGFFDQKQIGEDSQHRPYWEEVFDKTDHAWIVNEINLATNPMAAHPGKFQGILLHRLDAHGGRSQKPAAPLKEVLESSVYLRRFGRRVYEKIKETGSLDTAEIYSILLSEGLHHKVDEVVGHLVKLADPITKPDRYLLDREQILTVDEGFAVRPFNPFNTSEEIEVFPQKREDEMPIRRTYAERENAPIDFDGVPVYRNFASALLASEVMMRWLNAEGPRTTAILQGYGAIESSKMDITPEELCDVPIPSDPMVLTNLKIPFTTEGKKAIPSMEDDDIRLVLYHKARLSSGRNLQAKIEGRVKKPVDLPETESNREKAEIGLKILLGQK